jgi:hypothetical protein
MCLNPTTPIKLGHTPPIVLRFWSGLYSAVPKINIPGTQFDIFFAVLSALFLTTVRILFANLYTSVLEWDGENIRTKNVASYSVSIVHSLVLCVGLWSVLKDQPYAPMAKMNIAPKYWQDASTALMQFCTGYMVYDFMFIMIERDWVPKPEDYAFLAHHVVTALYMSQTRALGYGHISAMGLMFTGEVTNPSQSFHSITRYAIQMVSSDSLWHAVHPYAEILHAAMYGFVRSVVGPLQILHISCLLIFTKQGRSIPFRISIPWMIMTWGIIIGSIPWTLEGIEMVKDGLTVKYHKDYDYGPGFEL